MSELVRLHRDPLATGTHVLALPPWLAPATPFGRYWHVPRSAEMHDAGHHHLFTVHLWCGQARYLDTLDTFAFDPPEEDRCGTCVGRRAGYERADGLIFTPRDAWALPKKCPSTTPDSNDYRLCFACGRPTSAARGWNSYGLARHPPGPGLVERYEPCPRHGWARIEARGETLVCGTFRCTHNPLRSPGHARP